MIYKPKNPIGYRNLLTWRQAGEIYIAAKKFTAAYLDKIRDRRLIDHINDSARSVQRNIEEGFKRATTKEYIEFLGFSRGSLEELKRDFEELKREWTEEIRWHNCEAKGAVLEQIGRLLDLIYGEDCMMGRQILSLENKMVKDKTVPRNRVIMNEMDSARADAKRFWAEAEKRFGIIRDEKGIVKKRANKGKEG